MKVTKYVTGIAVLMLSYSLFAQQVKFLHPKVIDNGKVTQGEVINGEIQFVNIGDDYIEIDNIRPSCGCTAVTPSKLVYASGDTARIPFKVETKNFRGVIRKTIKITFKGGEPKSHLVVVQANVVTELNVSPSFISFQNVPFQPDTTVTEFLEIENSSNQAVQIQKISAEGGDLKIFPDKVSIPSGKSHLIRLEFTPTRVGRTNARIHIVSDHTSQSEINIPVFISVVKGA